MATAKWRKTATVYSNNGRPTKGRWARMVSSGFGFSNRRIDAPLSTLLERGAEALHDLAARLDGETLSRVADGIKRAAERAHDWADQLATVARETRKQRALEVLQNLAEAESAGRGAPIASSDGLVPWPARRSLVTLQPGTTFDHSTKKVR